MSADESVVTPESIPRHVVDAAQGIDLRYSSEAATRLALARAINTMGLSGGVFRGPTPTTTAVTLTPGATYRIAADGSLFNEWGTLIGRFDPPPTFTTQDGLHVGVSQVPVPPTGFLGRIRGRRS